MTASVAATYLARQCVRIVPRGFHHHVVVHAPGSPIEVTWAVHDREDRARGAADDATRLLAAFVDLGLARRRLTPCPIEDDGEIA